MLEALSEGCVKLVETLLILREAGLGPGDARRFLEDHQEELGIAPPSLKSIEGGCAGYSAPLTPLIKALRDPSAMLPLKIGPELALMIGYVVERGILPRRERRKYALKFTTASSEIAEVAESLGVVVKRGGNKYRVRTRHTALCYLLSSGHLPKVLRSLYPEEFERGRGLALIDRSRQRRRARKRVDPLSLTFEAVLLLRGLPVSRILEILGKSRDYGVSLALVSETDIKEMLNGAPE